MRPAASLLVTSRRSGARSLGVIGCGYQAETQVACIRAAVPTIERVVAFCRTPESLAAFCGRTGAEPGESHRDAAEAGRRRHDHDVARPRASRRMASPGRAGRARPERTSSRAASSTTRCFERASFVCCDWLEQAKLESGDLVEPVQAGVLDWLEVHELHEVVSGELAGRQTDEDIVVFKSNGLAAWDVALGAAAVRLARERGIGTVL